MFLGVKTHIYIIIPLIITLALESIMSYILFVRKSENYIRLFIINVITNLSLNIISNLTNLKISLYMSGYLGVKLLFASNIQIYILEVIIVIVEALYYNKNMLDEDKFILNYIKNKKLRCYVYSLMLNALSYFGGIMIHSTLNI